MVKLTIDLGTTYINMAFYDTDKNSIIAYRDMPNRQSLYGRDVINRILTATRDKSYVKKMKDLVVDDICDAIDAFLTEYKYHMFDIETICLSGNTTMISILLEYDISSMGISPYRHSLDQSIVTDVNTVFENKQFSPNCRMILTGCASAFIGGDILSGLLYISRHEVSGSDISNQDESGISGQIAENYLFIDMGTNGEMVLSVDGHKYAASTACGPAFEMSLKRQHAYGSSAIDAIALGLMAGKISREGILSEAYIEKGLTINNIRLDAELIREILLAKAAIASGIQALIKHAGTDYEHIEKLYIAGGFGEYLNIENAVRIGLIPEALKDRISILGNTSLKGALILTSDKTATTYIDKLSKEIEVIQLADTPNYQDILLNNMYFKKI